MILSLCHFLHDYHNFVISRNYQYENNFYLTIKETHTRNFRTWEVKIVKQSNFYLLYECEQLTAYATSLMPTDNAN